MAGEVLAVLWCCSAVALQYVRWPVGKVQVQVRGGKLMDNGVRWNAGAAIPDSVLVLGELGLVLTCAFQRSEAH